MDPDELDQRLSALRHAPLPGGLTPASDVRALGDRRRQRARVAGAAAVVALVAGAAIASASVLGQDGTTPRDIASPDATLSMSTEPSASPSASPSTTFTPSPDIPPNGTAVAIINEIRETPDGLVLVYDKVELLTGEAARNAKIEAGMDPDEPPDYWMINANDLIRQAILLPTVEVVGTTELSGTSTETPSTLDRLLEVAAERGPTLFELRFDADRRITKVVEIYLA